MIRFVFLFTFASMLLPIQAAPGEAPSTSYRLGIFPYMASRQTVEFFGPVAASMGVALQQPVRLESDNTFPAFSRRLAQHSYDIALIQPFDYPTVVEKLGYIPIAQLAVPLVSQFFVRNDSRYRNIEDLRGTTVAMPPAQSANARMTLRALYDNHMIPGKDLEIRYFNSHDSCIQQVWAGTASACATARPPIRVFEQRMQARLRPIFDTPAIPHVVFVAHPRVPSEQRAKLQKLITGWNQTADGRIILKNLGFPGFVAPKPNEYTVMQHYDTATSADDAAPAARKELLLGVFPFFNPRQLAQSFAPMLPVLSKSVGTDIHLRTASSFDSFSDTLSLETYDIVVVQPFDYLMASRHGYLPLAGMREQLRGSFFVLENSPYQKIADFRGKVVAMPPFNAAQSHLGRHALRKAGLIPDRDVTIDYRKNHNSCLLQVQQQAAAACITADITPSMLPEKNSRSLRPVGLTEKVPGVLFMAHKRLSETTQEQLKAEITSWKDSVDGRKVLKSIGLGELVPVNIADYQNLPRTD